MNTLFTEDSERELFGQVPFLRGEWKKWPNNPSRPGGEVHYYCPPEHVESEMERLIRMHDEHEKSGVPPEVEAAWLHHRFTQIHPFQDGNGRVARAIASLVFIRATWFPVTIDRDRRTAYIAALEAADGGDLRPLVYLFSRLQSIAFRRALSVLEPTPAPSPFKEEGLGGVAVTPHELSQTSQVIAAAATRLQKRGAAQSGAYNNAFDTADHLKQIAKQRLLDVAQDLNDQLRPINDAFTATVSANGEADEPVFRGDVAHVAQIHQYTADLRTYRSSARLLIAEEHTAEFTVSLHAVGTDFVGVMAAVAFVKFGNVAAAPGSVETPNAPVPVSDDAFLFACSEPTEQVSERFAPWLESALVRGLDEWRRRI